MDLWTKLNPTGSALIYSTYFGGSGDWTEDSDLFYGENPAGIAIEAQTSGRSASMGF